MKKMIALISVLISTTAFAAGMQGYDLKIELSIDGKHLSSPRLQSADGEKASVIQETPHGKIFMDVVTTEKDPTPKKGILMKFTVGKINADGTRTTLASPQILTLENSAATITQANDDGTNAIKIKVTPTRVTLK